MTSLVQLCMAFMLQAEIVANLQLQLKRETERLDAMRVHLDPNRKSEKEEKASPKPVNPSMDAELTGAAAVHKMAQLESNFLAQSLGGGIQNIFGAKAAAAAAAFAGLTQNSLNDRMRPEEPKSKFYQRFVMYFWPGFDSNFCFLRNENRWTTMFVQIKFRRSRSNGQRNFREALRTWSRNLCWFWQWDL